MCLLALYISLGICLFQSFAHLRSSFSVFLFIMFFCVVVKTLWPNPSSQRFPPVFSEFYDFSSRSLIHLSYFCLICNWSVGLDLQGEDQNILSITTPAFKGKKKGTRTNSASRKIELLDIEMVLVTFQDHLGMTKQRCLVLASFTSKNQNDE